MGSEILPPPPPYRGNAHEIDDLESMNDDSSMVAILWDHLAVNQPLSRAELIAANPIRYAHVWREYVRYHKGVTSRDEERLGREAQRWYHGLLIDRCLRRGWFVEEDGVLSVAAAPEAMSEPLRTLGGEAGVKRAMLREHDDAVRRVLYSESGAARRRPDVDAVERLRDSLQRYGQMAPIIRWEGDAPRGFDPVIIDGQTRMELLEELGVTPWIEDVDPRTPPAEVMMLRIDAEVARKALSKADREQYVATLAELGLDAKTIAERIGITAQAVYNIAERVGVARIKKLKTATSDAELREMRDAGWSLRDIANDVGVHYSTVKRRLDALDAVEQLQAEYDAAAAEQSDGTPALKIELDKRLPKPDSQGFRLLLATIEAIKETEARTRAQVTSGSVIPALRKAGLIENTEDGRIVRTPLADALMPEHQHRWMRVCEDCGEVHS